MDVIPDLLFTRPVEPVHHSFIIGMTVELMVWHGRKMNHPEA